MHNDSNRVLFNRSNLTCVYVLSLLLQSRHYIYNIANSKPITRKGVSVCHHEILKGMSCLIDHLGVSWILTRAPEPATLSHDISLNMLSSLPTSNT